MIKLHVQRDWEVPFCGLYIVSLKPEMWWTSGQYAALWLPRAKCLQILWYIFPIEGSPVPWQYIDVDIPPLSFKWFWVWSFPRDSVPGHLQNPFLSCFPWDVWQKLPFFFQSSLAVSNSSPAPPLVFLLQLLHFCRWLYPTVRALSRHSHLAVCRNCKLLFIYLLWKIPLAPICLKCYLYLFSPMKAWKKEGENKLLSLTSSLYLAEKQFSQIFGLPLEMDRSGSWSSGLLLLTVISSGSGPQSSSCTHCSNHPSPLEVFILETGRVGGITRVKVLFLPFCLFSLLSHEN